MPRIELGNGKSVEISTEQYLDLLEDDLRWERFMLLAKGEEINDPFHGSILKRGRDFDEENEEEIPFDEDFNDFYEDYD